MSFQNGIQRAMNGRAVRAKIRIVAVGQQADDRQAVQGRFVAARFIGPVALGRLGADKELHGLDIHAIHLLRHEAGGPVYNCWARNGAGRQRDASNSQNSRCALILGLFNAMKIVVQCVAKFGG